MKFFRYALAIAITAAAQTPAAKPIPRAPDGKPDLSGVWQAGGVSLYGERTSVAQPVTPVRTQPAPYQVWAEAKVKEYNDGLGKADPLGQCFLPGVPRITSMPMPLEIMQKPGRIAILY